MRPSATDPAGLAVTHAPSDKPCGGKRLRVKFYDVGQALSALIELPDGRRILVDTGEQPTRAGCGSACEAWSQHLLTSLAADVPDRKLEAIWTTHQHSDHTGNAEAILRSYAVGMYVDNGTHLGDGKKHAGPVARARTAARERGTKIVVVAPASTQCPIAGASEVTLRSVVPAAWPASCDKHPNDCSIGLRIDYCTSSILFMGDAEAREEAKMNAGRATLLQAGHHGSDTSSSAAFASAVHPGWVVISSGKKDEGTNQTYCHPRRSTVERLAALTGGRATRPMQVFQGSSCRHARPADWTTLDVSDRVYSTARDGDVTLVTTGDGAFAREP